MKTTIMHLMSLFLVLSFSASCGKKESGGSSSSNASNTLTTEGVAAQTNLLAWHNSASEGSIPSLANGLLAKIVVRYEKTISTSNGCNNNPISIGGINLGNFNFCLNTNTSGNGTAVTENVTMLPSGTKSTNNPKLVAALAPMLTPDANGLYLVSVKQSPSTQSSGSLFTITYTNSAGKTVVQLIDTGYNSRVNPVVTVDGINGKQISLGSISL